MSRKFFIILLIIIITGFIVIIIGNTKTQKSHSTQRQLVAAVNKPLVPSGFTSIQGQSISLASYKGKKLMVYLLATWCSSCQASLRTMINNASTLQKEGLEVVTLETDGDAGYPGPTMKQFLSETTNTNSLPSNFVFGTASKTLTASYNPNNTPDIYYLINPSGVVENISSTPSATMSTILKFAKESI
jgi:cytochrome oxidase Cu insertion factor (SCO1/SenC/PrrC family)